VTNEGTREEGSYVLSGIDIQAGGTWLGINKRGRVAFMYVESHFIRLTLSREVIITDVAVKLNNPSPLVFSAH
jgi:hypothetical protein